MRNFIRDIGSHQTLLSLDEKLGKKDRLIQSNYWLPFNRDDNVIIM